MILQSAHMSSGSSVLTNSARKLRLLPRLPLFRPGRERGSEQVAAVCYRLNKKQIEFLLVETHGGRWTFPKGGAEPGLTHAQSAALEAFEEAGVHGRIEERAFAQYARRKGGLEMVVNVHLCEVLRLNRPLESGRNPTWFSAEKARRKLVADRGPEHGEQLERILEQAVARIRKVQRMIYTT